MIKIKTNIDFGKLAKDMPEILDDIVDKGKHVYAEMSVKNITDGVKPPLAKASIEARKRGIYWGGKKVAPTSKTKPLDYTGSLIRSIKIHKQGIMMNEYGLHHHRGFNIPMRKGGATFNQPVPPRPFLALKEDAKTFSGKYRDAYGKFIDQMIKRMRKALRKAWH